MGCVTSRVKKIEVSDDETSKQCNRKNSTSLFDRATQIPDPDLNIKIDDGQEVADKYSHRPTPRVKLRERGIRRGKGHKSRNSDIGCASTLNDDSSTKAQIEKQRRHTTIGDDLPRRRSIIWLTEDFEENEII
ncbi:MAG: hypothetical protein MHMPM18_001021 [Marteilia pararefringens]